MNLTTRIGTSLLIAFGTLCSPVQIGATGSAFGAAASEIPHLQRHGTATQLIVDGKPFLMLAGELFNNTATSLEYIKPIWPKLVQGNFNTALVGVSWNQIEPQEGKFDFKVLDGVIQGARSHKLHLVLLWFGSWKNSLSSYAPDWVKRDFERFPRAQFQGGISIEELSTLSEANWDADARAFAALMRHVRKVDGRRHTVIMIQLENEVGMHTISRDHSPAADQALGGPVPKELMDYLQQHKDTLIPEFRQVWAANGFKTSGTWEEVFGTGAGTEGIFMAWNYARYIGRVVEAGKAECALPMFVNAAMYAVVKDQFTPSRGRPWDLVMDIWRAGGPQIDILSPDVYSVGDFEAFCAKYTQSGNPLLIPETSSGPGCAARAIYAFGRYDAIGFSPFGVDRLGKDSELTGVYGLLSRLTPLILEHQGNGTMSAVLLHTNDPPQKVKVGNYTLEVTPARPRGASGTTPPQQSAPSMALFIATGPDEYFVVGKGARATFSSNTPGTPLAGMGTVEEGTFINGRWVPGRWLAGDDTEQGDYLFLRNMGILRVTVYRYR
jgi:hypothetical protein